MSDTNNELNHEPLATTEPTTEPAVAEAPEQPRVIAGLQEGRLVNFVLLGGLIRPLLIIDAGPRTGNVKGILFFDGQTDRTDLPFFLGSDASGFAPHCATVVRDVPFDDGKELRPGTWHWPGKQPVVAAAVDQSALVTAIEANIGFIVNQITAEFETKFAEKVKEVNETVNSKLIANTEAVNNSIESHNRMLFDLAARGAEPSAEQSATPIAAVASEPSPEADVANAGDASQPAAQEPAKTETAESASQGS